MLSDVRVLDLSRLLPGPFCTLLLAEMGADVIKVERPQGGDYARFTPPMVDGTSAFFASLNRNKRAVTLNLKEERGVELLRELIAEADVVVESFRPGVMQRLGLDYEQLTEDHPRLIYCAISGYGQTGPMRDRAGHDLNYMARSGLLEQNARDGEAPVVPGFQVADIAGGALYGALNIVSALYARTRTGEGRFIDVSMTEGALSLHLPLHATRAAGEDTSPGSGLLTGGVPAYNVYETADGAYLAVGAIEPKFWQGFVEAVGLEEFASDGLDRGDAGDDVRRAIQDRIAERTREDWLEVFEELDICVEPVQSVTEVLEDELFRARDLFFELAGVRHMRTPVTPDDRDHTPAPEHGEHTDEVLTNLGYDSEELTHLRDDGII